MRSTLFMALLLLAAAPLSAQVPTASATGTPAGPTPAASPAAPPATAPVSAADMEYMREEARLIREEKLLEIKARIIGLQRKIDGPALPELPRADSTSPASMPSLALQSPVLLPPSNDAPFRLLSVYGSPGSYIAEVSSRGGVRISVRAGETLPGAWRVIRIAPTEVSVAKGTRHQALELGQ